MQQALIKIIIFSLLFIALPTPRTATAAVLARPPSNLGLVGYWNFDEGVGTVAGDSSGNGNNGTIIGATWTDGKRGKALDFNGTSDFVDLFNPASLYISGDVTLSAWVKPRTLNSNFARNVIVSGRRTESSPVYGLLVSPTSVGTSFQTDNLSNGSLGYVNRTGSTNINYNEWVMVSVVRSGLNLYFYKNGVLIGQDTFLSGNLYSSNGYLIGKGYNGGSFFFNGVIDDVRIYNRALSANEIQRLYSSGQVTRKTVSNQGLVGYWSFDEGAGTVAGDSSGNQMTATLLPSLTGWNNGKRGKALDVKEGHGADVANNSALNIADNLTVSLWLKARADHGGYAVHPVNKWTNTTDANYVLYYFGTTSGLNRRIQFYGNRGGNWGSISGSHIIDLDRWYHVTLEYNSTTGGQLYIDGQAVGTRNSSGVLSTNNNILRMGRFDGLIDDLRIYNRSLSAGEIQKLYEQSSATINSSQNNKMTDGLVGLWSFDGKDISSTTAYDRSGQGNNGTITGAKPTIGKIGQALEFDGITNKLVVSGNTMVPVGATQFSVSVWAKKNTVGGGPVVYKNGPFFLNMGSTLGNSAYVVHTTTNGWRGATGSTILETNRWYHLVLTYNSDNSLISLYVDGELDGTGVQSGGITLSINCVGIGFSTNSGCDSGVGYSYFKGAVDDVRIYNRALSAEEVKQLYLMGK